MATVRTFICLELPSDLRGRLSDVQEELQPLGQGVSWTKPDGIHLTLKFLGDVESYQIPSIEEAVAHAASEIRCFYITLSGLGAFPDFRRPRVLWVGIQEPMGLLIKLQKKIETELVPLGYPKEERKFSPHLTLGRVKNPEKTDRIMTRFQKMDFAGGSFEAGTIIIMRSDLLPGGAVYTPIRTIKLKL